MPFLKALEDVKSKLSQRISDAIMEETHRMMCYGSPVLQVPRGIIAKAEAAEVTEQAIRHFDLDERARRCTRAELEIARQVSPRFVPASNRARVGNVEVERNSYVTTEQARRFLDLGRLDEEFLKEEIK